MLGPNLFRTCRQISLQCPVESSIYGYYPSLAGNSFLLAWFSLFLVINIIFGIKYKTWTYTLAMTLGCLTEAIGYIGRVLLRSNPYNKAGFQIQIICLIIAPAFFAASIYLTLKHLTLCFGPQHSLIQPRYYTWLFISCDVMSLILQGAGGGIAATATTLQKQSAGNSVSLAGIVFQVFTLFVFGIMASAYFFRQRYTDVLPSQEARDTQNRTSFKLFMGGLIVAYVCILMRCAYRIAELAPGWRNAIMVSEVDFMVLDGAAIGLAALCLSVFHPGFCFERMRTGHKQNTDLTQKEKRALVEQAEG